MFDNYDCDTLLQLYEVALNGAASEIERAKLSVLLNKDAANYVALLALVSAAQAFQSEIARRGCRKRQ